MRGVVQGVGFRPFVFGAARSLALSGFVRNDSDAVRIDIQGPAESIEAFLQALRRDHPAAARIESLDVAEAEPVADSTRAFEIVPSEGRAAPRPAIPPDLATCSACLDEIRTPGARRFAYPFTNCTRCGPRWSIIEHLPYDRPRTSMRRFTMCPACRAEYEDPGDRRFHAQPIACPACGPELRLVDPRGRETARGDEALAAAARALLAGRIVALKGLGGFQLLCDAENDGAVDRLRQRKRRPHKPLALLFASVEQAARACDVSAREAAALASPDAPILLLRRRGAAARTEPAIRVSGSVAPGNPCLGVMLPSTPLHHLLIDRVARPLVCTSGNLAEEPMATRTAEAVERLGSIADVILTHNRAVVRPVDDSVAQMVCGEVQVLRRARGFAPRAIEVGGRLPSILALGGHLKNTVALSVGSQVVVGQHVGDLDNVAGVEVHRRAARDLVDFFRARPEAVACDLHPDYASTRHAEELAAGWDVPLVRVQHHHAHLAACLAEQGRAVAEAEDAVLGFSWDGTGYGPDGTVWGGEVLRTRGAGFERVAHLRTFPLPGGDRAVRQPRRSALGVLYEALGQESLEIAGAWFRPSELETLATMLSRGLYCPRTSSMGRLFDAVAAIAGMPGEITFEGQAAMALQFAAEQESRAGGPVAPYPVRLEESQPAVIDSEPLVRAVLADRRSGASAGRIAAGFHEALAEACVLLAQRAGCASVALAGGCFQNRLLTERVRDRLAAAGFEVLWHRQFPPGDGAIALGQAVVAARQLRG